MQRLDRRAEVRLNDYGDGWEVDEFGELADVVDEVGEQVDLVPRFREDDREGAFAYVDGELFVGNGHGGLLDAAFPDAEECQLALSVRSGLVEWPDHALAFGHVANGVAVIEGDVLSADLDDVAAALLAHGYAKVYVIDAYDAAVTRRVARRLSANAVVPDRIKVVDEDHPLDELVDDVGDEHRLAVPVDDDNRTGLFIYVDGEMLIKHDSNAVHWTLIDELADGDDELVGNVWAEHINDVDVGVPFASGHLSGDAAVIDVIIGVDVAKVVAALVANGVAKVYTTDGDRSTIYRVAVVNGDGGVEMSNVTGRLRRRAMVEDVVDDELWEMLTTWGNTLEIGDEEVETVDALTGKFARCLEVTVHRVSAGSDEVLFDGYVEANTLADIVNGEV